MVSFSSRLVQWAGSLAVAFVLLLSGSLPANAATLQVAPVSVSILPMQTAQSLWLSNTGNDTIHAQVRVFRWLQKGGQNLYEGTTDLLISPPFLMLEPGQRRLVRVMRAGSVGVSAGNAGTKPADRTPLDTVEAQREKSYRLIVDELPVSGYSENVNFVMQYSIPVFLPAENNPPRKPTLHWKLQNEPGSQALVVTNMGTIRGQLADVKLISATGKAFELQRGLLGYVLPGATMHWRIPFAMPGAAAQYTIEALLNGVVTRDIQLSESVAP